MNKLIYKPISLGTSVLAGLLADAVFRRVWRLAAHQDEAPQATDARRSWTEVLAAAALQGAVFSLVRATVDRAAAEGTRKLTGSWPGDEDDQPARRRSTPGEDADPADRGASPAARYPGGCGRPGPGGSPQRGKKDGMAMRSVALRDTAASIRRSAQDPLGIYLNDHLAGATAGLELARRVAGARQVPATGPELQRFAEEVAEDRDALLRIMGTLGVPVRSYKVWAAWAGEKAGRLKPNGHLTTRSPLSNLEELEILRLGVEGKAPAGARCGCSPTGTGGSTPASWMSSSPGPAARPNSWKKPGSGPRSRSSPRPGPPVAEGPPAEGAAPRRRDLRR